MKASYAWLQTFFDAPLPPPEKVVEALTFHSFEVEGVLGSGKEAVFDIDVLPNRSSDCLSHRGIAKELSVVLDVPLKDDPLRKNVSLAPHSKTLSVTIEDETLCRRFSAVVVNNISVHESPLWLKGALESIGQKSINNIVDATNYVMFSIGQPLHAFDSDKLKTHGKKEKAITVRTAKAGEKITTLTNEEYTLPDGALLITDGTDNTPLGIAGIKGGIEAAITDATKNIIIEAANFNPTNVRQTSRALKLRTDASTRFENEPAEELTAYGLAGAVELITSIAGGTAEGYVDIRTHEPAAYVVGVSTREVNGLLGTNLSEKEIISILRRVDFSPQTVSPREEIVRAGSALVGTPYKVAASVRFDAPGSFDCSSLTAYLYAHAGVAIPRVAVDQYLYGESIERGELRPGDLIFSNTGVGTVRTKSLELFPGRAVPEGVDHVGVYMGDDTVLHSSRTIGSTIIESLDSAQQFLNIVGFRRMVHSEEKRIVVSAPFERLDVRRAEDLIEEIGRIYGYENISAAPLPKPSRPAEVNKRLYYEEKVRTLLRTEGFSEVYTYALSADGDVRIQNPLAQDKSYLRTTLAKGMRDALAFNSKNMPLLGLSRVALYEFGTVFGKKEEHTNCCIGLFSGDTKKMRAERDAYLADIRAKFEVALGGELQAAVCKDGVLEFDFDATIQPLATPHRYEFPDVGERPVQFKSISIFPFVVRDIAVWVPASTSQAQVHTVITETAGDLLVRMALFDTYEKEERTSYAFRLVFQSHERTLTDEEVNTAMEVVQKALENAGWEVR